MTGPGGDAGGVAAPEPFAAPLVGSWAVGAGDLDDREERGGRGARQIVDEEFRGYAALHHDQEKILIVDIGSPWYINEYWKADAEDKAASLHGQGFEVYLLSRDHGFENFEKVTAGSKVSMFKYNP